MHLAWTRRWGRIESFSHTWRRGKVLVTFAGHGHERMQKVYSRLFKDISAKYSKDYYRTSTQFTKSKHWCKIVESCMPNQRSRSDGTWRYKWWAGRIETRRFFRKNNDRPESAGEMSMVNLGLRKMWWLFPPIVVVQYKCVYGYVPCVYVNVYNTKYKIYMYWPSDLNVGPHRIFPLYFEVLPAACSVSELQGSFPKSRAVRSQSFGVMVSLTGRSKDTGEGLAGGNIFEDQWGS